MRRLGDAPMPGKERERKRRDRLKAYHAALELALVDAAVSYGDGWMHRHIETIEQAIERQAKPDAGE